MHVNQSNLVNGDNAQATEHIRGTVFIFILFCFHLCPWSTKPVSSLWGIFVAITKNTLYGSKLSIFLL